MTKLLTDKKEVAIHKVIQITVPVKLFGIKIPFLNKTERLYLCTTVFGLQILDKNGYNVQDKAILDMPVIQDLIKKYKNHHLFLTF